MAVYKEHILSNYDDGEIIETRREAKVTRATILNDLHVTYFLDGSVGTVYFRRDNMEVDNEIRLSLEELEEVVSFFKLPPLEVKE